MESQSGKSGTIRESNQASGVRNAHYALYYVQKKLHFGSQNWHKENSSLVCGCSPIKIHFSDCLKNLISRFNDGYEFSIKNY